MRGESGLLRSIDHVIYFRSIKYVIYIFQEYKLLNIFQEYKILISTEIDGQTVTQSINKFR